MLQLRVNVSYPGKSSEKTTAQFLFLANYLNLSLSFFIKIGQIW